MTQPANLVGVFLAGADMSGVVTRLMYPAFNDPARFQVISMTAEWNDVQRDLAHYRPDALVLEAALAPDPETLKQYLASLAGSIAIVVLPSAWAQFQGQFEHLQNVRGVFLSPPNWTAIANATYSAVQTARIATQSAAPAQSMYQSAAAPRMGGQAVIGTRTIAFTSFTGGTGKSSIAEAMAVELARNHIRTLLCSFNSPPAAAGHFSLRVRPSAAEWISRPSSEGFQASLQKVQGMDDLDVLVAPNDYNTLNLVAGVRPPEDPASIRNLVFSAYSGNYGAILLDLPPFADSMWAIQPLLAASIAVIVCRPTRHDQIGAIRAYKLMTEQLAEQIRVPREAIYAVMNFVSPRDNMSQRDFQAAIVEMIKVCPPILASFPFTPELPGAQNMGNSPINEPGCEGFARAAYSLTSKLIGTGAKVGNNGQSESEGKGLFGIKFRLR